METGIDQNCLFADEPHEELTKLLGEIPGRWGRMTPLSRLLIVETGRVLRRHGILQQLQRLDELGKCVGLVGGTKRGSLKTDRAFVDTMAEGAGLASPAIFGYTLPNIPLAEAAVAFGLTGPVYAIYNVDSPLGCAEQEAHLLLKTKRNLDFILACAFDHYDTGDRQDTFSVNILVVE